MAPYSCETYTEFMKDVDERQPMFKNLVKHVLGIASWIYRREHSWVVYGLKHYREERLMYCTGVRGVPSYKMTIVSMYVQGGSKK